MIRYRRYRGSFPYGNGCPSNQRFQVAFDMLLLCIGILDQSGEWPLGHPVELLNFTLFSSPDKDKVELTLSMR
ncbi:hypothetical protein, partial [Bacillus subtilis]|uniref:hypothetical protein n=1 Tax=Bacillus subtilis TaxID=1423 RepID=UPI002DB70CF5